MRVPFQLAGDQQPARASGAVARIGVPSEQQFPRIRVPVADTADPNALAAPSRIWGGVLEQATGSIGRLFAIHNRAQEELEVGAAQSEIIKRSGEIRRRIQFGDPEKGVGPDTDAANWTARYADEMQKAMQDIRQNGIRIKRRNDEGQDVEETIRVKTGNSWARSQMEMERVAAQHAVAVQSDATKFLVDRTMANYTEGMMRYDNAIKSEQNPDSRQAQMDARNSWLLDFEKNYGRYMDMSKIAVERAKADMDLGKSVVENVFARMAASGEIRDLNKIESFINGDIDKILGPMAKSFDPTVRLQMTAKAQEQYRFVQEQQDRIDRKTKEAAEQRYDNTDALNNSLLGTGKLTRELIDAQFKNGDLRATSHRHYSERLTQGTNISYYDDPATTLKLTDLINAGSYKDATDLIRTAAMQGKLKDTWVWSERIHSAKTAAGIKTPLATVEDQLNKTFLETGKLLGPQAGAATIAAGAEALSALRAWAAQNPKDAQDMAKVQTFGRSIIQTRLPFEINKLSAQITNANPTARAYLPNADTIPTNDQMIEAFVNLGAKRATISEEEYRRIGQALKDIQALSNAYWNVK